MTDYFVGDAMLGGDACLVCVTGSPCRRVVFLFFFLSLDSLFSPSQLKSHFKKKKAQNLNEWVRRIKIENNN